MNFNLMAQENIGIFNLGPQMFFLPTPQESLICIRRKIKAKALTTTVKIDGLTEELRQLKNMFDSLVIDYRKADKKLALIDGRLKRVKTKRERERAKLKLSPALTSPNKLQLKEALKLMSQDDRDELLKDLLK